MGLSCGHAGLGWALNPVTGVLIRRENGDTDRERRMPWKTNTGRMLCDDGDGVMCTQTKKGQGHHQSLGERHGSLQPAEGTNPADTLIFDSDTEDHGSGL